MHVHLPKPLHGWREFAGEVGIIVLGVLIALGAQQVVESWHWNNEVVEFRAALDSDLSYDLGTYQYRLIQGHCVTARLDQLERWLERSRSGTDGRLSGPISLPMRLALRMSAWEARTGEVYNHIPLKTRLAYGAAYDNLANFEDHSLEERAIWRDIGNFDGLASLTRDDQVRLGGLIRRERMLDFTFGINWPILEHIADRLDVHAARDPEDPSPLKEFCRSIG
ncbi:hypothetical protein M8312_10880 [Sphingomonas sp. KRR8]|uniref:hypothetical protein n=1 Tax=Sphingomonas sp. KRR8 TaxID=2942996 RepID=UPI0020204302|nr:hypothetical protein [Sphingomonas sp. KRR8]URD60284.1 hypothetical protein M8312_10880 [Sphingomonas sp. KRR8]